MKVSKLSLKIVLPAVLCILGGITLTIAIILNIFVGAYDDLSSDYIETLTHDYAQQIKDQMAQTLITAETESLAIKSIMERPDATREEVLALVRAVLDHHKELVGIGVGFEPNAFDGKDAQYRGEGKHSDENGRFVPYTYREDGEIDYTLLDGYDDPGDYGSWYNVPQRTNQTYVTNPYWYEVGSEQYLMFTCVAPLRGKEGQFIGMTGFDTPVATLNSIVENARVFETGYLSLIAPDGTIAYHPDNEVMGSSTKEYFPQEVYSAIDEAYNASETVLELDALPSGGNQLARYTLIPIEVGLSGGQWIVLTSVPVSEINKVTNNSIRTAIITGAIVTIVAAIGLSLILSKSVIRPVKILRKATDKIAGGSLDIDIPIKSDDEFGKLTQSLTTVVDTLSRLIDDMGMLASAAEDGQLDVRADALRHEGSYREIVEGVNHTLDAVVAPMQISAKVLSEMSMGNLNTAMEGGFKGDYALVQNALNGTLDSLRGYISEITQKLADIARGNFATSIASQYHGDFVALKSAINSIADQLSSLMHQINLSANQVSTGTQQVASGAQSVSQGAMEQDSAINELKSNIVKIAEQTKLTAENATRTNQHVKTAKMFCLESNDSMKKMQDAMENINSSSSDISKIIKVIDDIAFQTNILALNAAVEAARAGEHGKGFAVVAEEVRNLAAKSAIAAKETTDLIEASIRSAEGGTQIANDTAKSLEDIIQSVEQTATIAEQIAAASGEQAIGIDQVNKGIEQLSQVVQNNSATAQQAAAAAQELNSQADLLRNMIGQFTLKQGDTVTDAHAFYSDDISKLDLPVNSRFIQPKALLSSKYELYDYKKDDF